MSVIDGKEATMKKCKRCGLLVYDSAETCSMCNGTEFIRPGDPCVEGNYDFGTNEITNSLHTAEKQQKDQRICSHCGMATDSDVCPYCGYSSDDSLTVTHQQKRKGLSPDAKRGIKLILRCLIGIFCFSYNLYCATAGMVPVKQSEWTAQSIAAVSRERAKRREEAEQERPGSYAFMEDCIQKYNSVSEIQITNAVSKDVDLNYSFFETEGRIGDGQILIMNYFRSPRSLVPEGILEAYVFTNTKEELQSVLAGIAHAFDASITDEMLAEENRSWNEEETRGFRIGYLHCVYDPTHKGYDCYVLFVGGRELQTAIRNAEKDS